MGSVRQKAVGGPLQHGLGLAILLVQVAKTEIPGKMAPLATASPTHEEIGRRVIHVIAETQKVEMGKITASSTFDELGIDSFDGINTLFALETGFEASIPDEQ